MSEHDDDLTEFFAALPTLEAAEQAVGPAPYRRVELDFGGETAWFEGMFGGRGIGRPPPSVSTSAASPVVLKCSRPGRPGLGVRATNPVDGIPMLFKPTSMA